MQPIGSSQKKDLLVLEEAKTCGERSLTFTPAVLDVGVRFLKTLEDNDGIEDANFKYVNGTTRREKPENTMTESMFATEKLRLQSSVSQCDPLVTPPKKDSLALEEVKTRGESSDFYRTLSQSFMSDTGPKKC